MKHLILFLLAFVDMDGFGQVPDTTQPMRQFDRSKWTTWVQVPKYDTIRAELLVTFTCRRLNIAHARVGYVVIKGGEVIGYLNDRKERWPAQVNVWSYKITGGIR